MKKKTLEALHGSVQKWRDIVTEGAIGRGVRDCPLCQIFYAPGSATCCEGCLVNKKTGQKFCRGTPYPDFVRVQGVERKRAAIAMYDFLVGLLPEKERKNAAR